METTETAQELKPITIDGVHLDRIIYALQRQTKRENVEVLLHFLSKVWIAQQTIDHLMTVAKGDRIQQQAKALIDETPVIENYEIGVISIAHLAQNDRRPWDTWTMDGEFGYLLRIPSDDEELGLLVEETKDDLPSLIPIIRWAVELNFDYVMFDRDGNTVEGLPVYQ